MKIIDITPTISSRTAVFPGDQPFARTVVMDIDRGDHLGLSSIETTVHIGAHADAPNHYRGNSEGIDTRDPDRYLGRCQVIRVSIEPGARILPADLGNRSITAPRVLFATGSFPDPDHWRDDFNALSPELIHLLADRGVVLVGIDTPSIDPAPDKELPAHRAVADRDLAILEGIVLEDVAEGTYLLSALPLKLERCDAGPVRAVLVPLEALRSMLDQASSPS